MNTLIDAEVACSLEEAPIQTLRTKIMVRNSDIGLGVFAARRINAGREIFRLVGKIIGLKEVLGKGEQSPMPIQIACETYIDVGYPAMYLNHSCDPNSGIINDTILIALRDIEKDEEIRFDYSTTMSEKLWTMQCDCGSKNCRGLIEDFHFLPEATQHHYLRLGIVQKFIVREFIHDKGPVTLNKHRIGQKFIDPCLTTYNMGHIWK